ncbi:hypothetical protein C1645_839794 [Glomus cerebriforme]|uniref:SAM domain-containing protein n=1 Tax=Glomus cerebriforme TaxID=658196 RepID=A0A397S551_9GLOM|nr:hypothetical protein C1645_839794 [Glomus cerebriforme]
MSSETNTPASTFTSVTATGNDSVTLAEEIKKYDTAKLIEFLQGQENLGLNEAAIKILENEEVNGLDFFDLTEEKLERHGMKMGPATRLVKFAKEFGDKIQYRPNPQNPPSTQATKHGVIKELKQDLIYVVETDGQKREINENQIIRLV